MDFFEKDARRDICAVIVSYNPEPLADFFDLFYIGEGETVYNSLLDLYKRLRASENGGSPLR